MRAAAVPSRLSLYRTLCGLSPTSYARAAAYLDDLQRADKLVEVQRANKRLARVRRRTMTQVAASLGALAGWAWLPAALL